MGVFLQQLNRNTQKLRKFLSLFPPPRQSQLSSDKGVFFCGPHKIICLVKIWIYVLSVLFLKCWRALWPAAAALLTELLLQRSRATSVQELLEHLFHIQREGKRKQENYCLDGRYLIGIQSNLFCIGAAQQRCPPALEVSKYRQLVSPWICPWHWPCTGNPSLLYP